MTPLEVNSMEWKKEEFINWFKKTKWKWPIIFVIALMFLSIIGYYGLLFGGKQVVDERLFVLDEATTIVDEEGQELGKLYKQNRIVVPIDQVPEHVQHSFIAIEDSRFYDHAGVDFKATLRAIYRDLIAMKKVEGGSTITQQLAKNLFLTNDKTWSRKFKEVMASLYLERNVSKERILQYYLNTIYFGEGLYGIETASQYFFNKPATKLTVEEGALLAALPKGPNYYDPSEHPERAKERRNIVIQRMNDTGYLTAEEAVKLQRKAINLELGSPEKKPWLSSYLDMVVKEAKNEYELSNEELYEGGYRIVVGVDETIQEISYNAMQNDQLYPGSQPGVEGTFLLMDEKTGVIVAAHGARDYKKGDLNRVYVKQQPGSVMKPLAVYGPALELDNYAPYSLLVDQKRSYGDYTPKNYDNRYAGSVSMYEALMQSKNAPAVWLLNEIGIDYSKKYLSKMDINLSENGLGIALGGLSEGVTPIDLVKAYRPFAHKGEVIEPHTILQVYNEKDELVSHSTSKTKQVFKPQTAWDMTRMLESVVEDGTGQQGSYDKALAGKTGSTQHQYAPGKTNDAWFVGYTPQYVGAVWMGYDEIDKEHYLNGGSVYPTRLMKDILSKVDQTKQLQNEFVKPDNVEELQKPIPLPTIESLKGDLDVGAFSVTVKLQWTKAKDNRVVYRIYRQETGEDTFVGEVTGQGEYTVKGVSVFHEETYYVVPYNPLTKVEGKPSNTIEVKWKW